MKVAPPHLILNYSENNLTLINHIYREDSKKETINLLLRERSRNTLMRILSNDWGRLAQGNDNGVKVRDIIGFIHKSQVLSDKKVIYTSFVCDY